MSTPEVSSICALGSWKRLDHLGLISGEEVVAADKDGSRSDDPFAISAGNVQVAQSDSGTSCKWEGLWPYSFRIEQGVLIDAGVP